MQKMRVLCESKSPNEKSILSIKKVVKMTIYTVLEINSEGLKVQYEDNSWAILPTTIDMLPEDIDDLAAQFAPKNNQAPAFMTIGTQRSAVAKPADEPVEEDDGNDEPPALPAWLEARMAGYGSLDSQIEYITENGLDAWQSHVAEIKAANPKPSE